MGSGATGRAASPELLAVGQRLKAARELRRLTLDSVEEATHIRQTYLQAIEEGRAEDVPGEVFLKGFMRTYANHLGLDGTEMVEGYKQALHRTQTEAAGEAPDGARRAGHRTAAPRQRAARLRGGRVRSRRRGGARVGWWLAGLAAIALTGWAVAAGGRHGTLPASSPAPSTSAAEAMSSATTAVPSKTVPATSSSAASSPPVPRVQVGFGHSDAGWQDSYVVTGAASLQVTISAYAPCWTRRWVDGASVYTDETLAQSGPQSVTWTASKLLKIWMGNAPGITSIVVNGQPTRALPPQGSDDSEWLTFTLMPPAQGA